MGTDDGQGNIRVVLNTTDGGTNWSVVDLSLDEIDPLSLYATDENTCFIVGTNDDNSSAGFLNIMVIKTTDKGESWSVQNAPEIQGLLLDVTFTSLTHGIAVGTDFTNDRMLIIYTTDGQSWQQATHPDEDYQLEKVTHSDTDHCWAIGTLSAGEGIPCMLKTVDGGLNWSKVDHPIVDGNFNDICFIDENTGWAPGIKDINDEDVGFLIHTKDGGMTWTDVELDLAAAGERHKTGNRSGLSILTFYLHPGLMSGKYRGVLAAYEEVDSENDYSFVSLIRYLDDDYEIIDPTTFENHHLWAYQIYYTSESGIAKSSAFSEYKVSLNENDRAESYTTYVKGEKKDGDNDKPVIKKKKKGIVVELKYGQLNIDITDNSNLKIGRSYDNVLINGEPALDQDGNLIKADDVTAIYIIDKEETGAGDNTIDLSDVTIYNFPNINDSYYENNGEMLNASVDVFCGEGNETVFGCEMGAEIFGNGGNDRLYGGKWHDSLVGGEGKDYLQGGGGAGKNELEGGDGDDVLVYNEGDAVLGGPDDDIKIKIPRTVNEQTYKTTMKNQFHEESKVDSLADVAGNDTLDYSQDSKRLFIDLDLTGDYQVIDEEGNLLYLVGQFENLIGSGYDDVIYVDPLDVPRFIDGGGNTNGDTVYVDSKGETPTDDGAMITIPGYEPITYINISEVIYENSSLVDDEENSNIPGEFSLSQNYPNPFNPKTTIKFALPNASEIELIIYDLLGKEVKVLAQGYHEAGYYSIVWNALNLPSGIYLYRLVAGDCVETRKLVLQQ